MKLIDKINSKIKESIKQKDTVKLDTLRSIKSAILIEEKSSKVNKLSDGDEIKILNRLYKTGENEVEKLINTIKTKVECNFEIGMFSVGRTCEIKKVRPDLYGSPCKVLL